MTSAPPQFEAPQLAPMVLRHRRRMWLMLRGFGQPQLWGWLVASFVGWIAIRGTAEPPPLWRAILAQCVGYLCVGIGLRGALERSEPAVVQRDVDSRDPASVREPVPLNVPRPRLTRVRWLYAMALVATVLILGAASLMPLWSEPSDRWSAGLAAGLGWVLGAVAARMIWVRWSPLRHWARRDHPRHHVTVLGFAVGVPDRVVIVEGTVSAAESYAQAAAEMSADGALPGVFIGELDRYAGDVMAGDVLVCDGDLADGAMVALTTRDRSLWVGPLRPLMAEPGTHARSGRQG